MRKAVRIGTRGSRLALVQAESVLARLNEVAAGLQAGIVKIATTGDRDRQTSLDHFSGQGVFVQELEKSLSDGKIDLAVHSLKDMPVKIPGGLRLAAVTERLDPRDVLVSRAGGLARLPAGSRIGTGSPRRSIQLHACRPDLEISPIRGNVDTRLRKVREGQYEGTIMAAAGLLRLGWQDDITEYLAVEDFVPEVGQGALGIEIRSDDRETAELVSLLNHEPTWRSVTAERKFMEALGGGCHAPIAALGDIHDGILRLQGMVASTGGRRILRASAEGDPESPELVGDMLARKMLQRGAAEYINLSGPR